MIRRFRGLGFVAAIGLICAGCASNRPPPPFEIHSAATFAAHHFGTSLSGPTLGDPSKISYADALDVQVRWYDLEQLHSRGLPLLASKATLVTARLADEALLSATSLTSNARIGWIDSTDAGQALSDFNPSRYFGIGESQSALPLGVTATFRAFDVGSARDQTYIRAEPRFVEISISRVAAVAPGASEIEQVAVGIQDAIPGKTSSDSTAWPPNVYQHETAFVDQPVNRFPQSFLLIVPFKLPGPANQGLAAFVTISAAGKDAQFQNAVAKCKADLAGGGSVAINPEWSFGLSRAMKELDEPDHRRAALVYLASRGEARLCEDVAMLADDGMLGQIADEVKREAPAAIEQANLDQYKWILDRSAIKAMQPLLAKAQLPPELFVVLTEHFGEPGRHSAAVDEIMHASASSADLRQHLASENYIYLQDSSPAARVRAFNWLAAQKLAPAGFDPLASPKQRRQALDRALSAGNIFGGGQ